MTEFGKKFKEALSKAINPIEMGMFLKSPISGLTIASIERYLDNYEKVKRDKEYIRKMIRILLGVK